MCDAFIEAYKKADGKKIDGQRVYVDYERGRSVQEWRPRRFGGGKGNTREARKIDQKVRAIWTEIEEEENLLKRDDDELKVLKNANAAENGKDESKPDNDVETKSEHHKKDKKQQDVEKAREQSRHRSRSKEKNEGEHGKEKKMHKEKRHHSNEENNGNTDRKHHSKGKYESRDRYFH